MRPQRSQLAPLAPHPGETQSEQAAEEETTLSQLDRPEQREHYDCGVAHQVSVLNASDPNAMSQIARLRARPPATALTAVNQIAPGMRHQTACLGANLSSTVHLPQDRIRPRGGH